MKNYVGIDLGTTNSTICSFDGEDLRLHKSPEQNDVTPSAIFIDRRGNKYVGKRAYDSAPFSPDNAAVLFKRLMGTSTPIRIPAVDIVMTPEECSAEILRVLFGYLPEEVRNDPEIGTVVTVPAAFNQMQKEASLAAAEMAGIGKVALMQEPVAAVMSTMHSRRTDGVFLLFDMGGGTLDVAIAQGIAGRVSLLSHGGIEMCGGRDFDRLLFDNVVKPWLLENFDLPEEFIGDPQYKQLPRLAIWATEKAKIELSAREDSVISLSETDMRTQDLSGAEIYLDIPLARSILDDLIEPKVKDAIDATRETLSKASLSPHDVERIVFIGGPSNYKPLRDKVSFELGIPGSTDVNPMIAVAQGAALFAESIDWSLKSRGRKSTRGTVSAGGALNLAFNYIARTPDTHAKLALKVGGEALPGTEFQIDSLDSGWSSGRLLLADGTTVDLPLHKNGENTFKVFVFDSGGGQVKLEQNKIVLTRTAATIDAIPASYSIGVEVLDRLGGRPTLDYLVKAGDPLPAEGKRQYKTAESLSAGGSGSINFKLWEGEIEDPITDNRPIGVLKITGTDFDDGVIAAGADLICDYKILDSGNVVIEASVPSIGGAFHSGHNFYSRQEGQIDFTAATKRVVDQSEQVSARIDHVASKVANPKLDKAREKLEAASSLSSSETDPEICKQADDNILAAKRLLAEVRKQHLQEIRQLDLDSVLEFFNEHVRQHARSTESSSFDNLARTAQRAIDRGDPDFENYLDQLKNKNFEILWRQEWFVITKFEWATEKPHQFPDKRRYQELVAQGQEAIQADDIDGLRSVVYELSMIRIGVGGDVELLETANILRG